MPLENLDRNQFEYSRPFACSQRFRSITVFLFISVGMASGSRAVLLSNTTPWELDLPSACTTWKAPLSHKSDESSRMLGYLALPVIIT